MRTLLLVAGAVVLASAVMAAPLWVQTYGSDPNNFMTATAVATDAAGYIYVSGWWGARGVVLKYSPAGVLVWDRLLSGPAGASITLEDVGVDAGGNVYATGTYTAPSYADYLTVKLGGSGTLQWAKYFDGGGMDYAEELVMTAYGTVVTGTSDSLGKDIVTIAYRPDGSEYWLKHYSGAGITDEQAAGVAADGMGNIYVTGSTNMLAGLYGYDYLTLKYDSSGTFQWMRRYNGPANGTDKAADVAVDPSSGFIVVTGSSYGFGSYNDYATVAYNLAGDSIWVQRYVGPGDCSQENCDDYGIEAAVSPYQVSFVTGSSFQTGDDEDMVTLAYDGTAPEPNWVQVHDGEAHLNDWANGAAASPGGSGIVCGVVHGPLPFVDCQTIKYRASGAILWSERYDGPDHLDDRSADVTVDNDGYVITVGYTETPTTYSMLILKYGPGCCVGRRGNVNGEGIVDLSDLSTLIYYLTSPQVRLKCPDAADINGKGIIDLSDLSYLIAYLTAKPAPLLVPCP